MIIAAYAGTGKTTMAKLYPQSVVDFVCMPYKYELEWDDRCGEDGKANPDNILREDWPYNYVSAVKLAVNEGKLLLIPSDLFVLALLERENIPYTLCYPQRSAKEVYRRRFIDRGNTEEFIEIFIDGWDQRIAALEQDTCGCHLVLRPDQFLSDTSIREYLPPMKII
jgi:hypothetical protein